MFDTMNSPNRNMAIGRAVREQKRSPSKVAKHFGISRQRVYQILNAFDAGVKSWVVVYLFSNLGLVSWRWFRGHLGDKG